MRVALQVDRIAREAICNQEAHLLLVSCLLT